jgi:hypothetical protein
LEIAKLYLRTADYTEKKVCGIYKIKNSKGRISYKIFAEAEDLALYLHKNKDKFSEGGLPVYSARKYRDFEGTEVRKVSADEIEKYLSERKTPIVD